MPPPEKVDIFKTFGRLARFFLSCVNVISSHLSNQRWYRGMWSCGLLCPNATAAQSQLSFSPGVRNQTLGTCWRSVFLTHPAGKEGLFVHSSFPSELPFRLSRRSPVVWKACEISRKGPESSDNGAGLLVTYALQKVSRWPCMVAIPGDLFPLSEATIEFRPCG